MLDLVSLLAHAPPWARVVANALLVSWGVATAFAALMRRVPAPAFDAFERANPRLAALARFCRKWGTDYEPALRALVAFVRGAPPADPPRLALVSKSPLDSQSRPAIPPPTPKEPQ